jgi:hypothetical protein
VEQAETTVNNNIKNIILLQESYLQFTPDLGIYRLLNGMW